MSRCYICGEDNPNVLQTHHVLPRRHGGEDTRENIVSLCANCHMAVESIYDDKFYSRIKNHLSDWKIQDATVGDAIREFCDDELNIRHQSVSISSKDELYDSYLSYCRQRDYPAHTSQSRFCEHLERLMEIEIYITV